MDDKHLQIAIQKPKIFSIQFFLASVFTVTLFHLADKRDIRIFMPVSDIERDDFRKPVLSNISKVEHDSLRSDSNSY